MGTNPAVHMANIFLYMYERDAFIAARDALTADPRDPDLRATVLSFRFYGRYVDDGFAIHAECTPADASYLPPVIQYVTSFYPTCLATTISALAGISTILI